MSNYSDTPWNPDTDNTIAADIVAAGPRSVTFSRLAYTDHPQVTDVVEVDAVAADRRWARRCVALAMGGAASVIVASAAVAFAAINSVDSSTSIVAAGGSTAVPTAAPIVRVQPPSGLPAAPITTAPVAPVVPDYVPAAAPQRPAAPSVTAAPVADTAPEPEAVPAPPPLPLPTFPPIVINLPAPPAAPPKQPPAKPDAPVLKGPLAIPSPEKTPPINPNLPLDAG